MYYVYYNHDVDLEKKLISASKELKKIKNDLKNVENELNIIKKKAFDPKRYKTELRPVNLSLEDYNNFFLDVLESVFGSSTKTRIKTKAPKKSNS
jgi:hypothetical protein